MGKRYYALKTGSTWGSWQESTANTFTFSGLTHNTTYYVKTKACDILGNCSGETSEVSIPTKNINKPTTAITIKPNTTNCSKSRTITVKGALAGTQLQYKIGSSGTWTNISNNGTFTTAVNNTIYARLYDGKNSSGEATLTITKNGDSTPVTQTKPTVSNITKTSATVTTGQTDNCGRGTVYYAIKESGGSYGSWQTSNSFTGLDAYTTYYVKTKANDVAGNGVKESTETSFTTAKPSAADVSYGKNGKTTVDAALDDLFSKNP